MFDVKIRACLLRSLRRLICYCIAFDEIVIFYRPILVRHKGCFVLRIFVQNSLHGYAKADYKIVDPNAEHKRCNVIVLEYNK